MDLFDTINLFSFVNNQFYNMNSRLNNLFLFFQSFTARHESSLLTSINYGSVKYFVGDSAKLIHLQKRNCV